MVIEWKLTKKRGNWRPWLEIKMIKSIEETALSVGSREVETTRPKPASNDNRCLPDKGERVDGWEPAHSITIDLVSDAVFTMFEIGNRLFEFGMDGQRAGQVTNAVGARAEFVHRLLCGFLMRGWPTRPR